MPYYAYTSCHRGGHRHYIIIIYVVKFLICDSAAVASIRLPRQTLGLSSRIRFMYRVIHRERFAPIFSSI